jgi:hypothetical protein
MSTPLHQRMLAFNDRQVDRDRTELMRKVWAGHPWMLDAYTGNYDDVRSHEILEWCYESFGEQASPIHGNPGTWYRGGATVDGWTWFGFSSETDMQKFMERWPAPTAAEDAA